MTAINEAGFIGLGSMGAPLARRLARYLAHCPAPGPERHEESHSPRAQSGPSPRPLRVYNRTPHKAAALLDAGPHVMQAHTLRDLTPCDVVFTCLALPEHVRAATTGPEGVYHCLRPGAVHVEMSTIAPQMASELAAEAAQRGVAYVQCTLGKTPAHAEAGQAPLFIGGDAAAVQRLEGVFAALGLPNPVGTVEAACAVKLISNLVGLTNLAVLAEGLRIGQAAGLDAATLLPLLQDTGARSFQMDVRGPWIAACDWTPRFALDLGLKDMRLGCGMAEQWGLAPHAMLAAREAFAQASAAGWGAADCCALWNAVMPQSAG